MDHLIIWLLVAGEWQKVRGGGGLWVVTFVLTTEQFILLKKVNLKICSISKATFTPTKTALQGYVMLKKKEAWDALSVKRNK